MQALASNPGRSVTTSRLCAVLYPALAAPAAALLVVTALVRGDNALVLVAIALAIGSAVAGALTALLAYRLRLAERSGILAIVLWLVALGAPVLFTVELGNAIAIRWRPSSALQDALSMIDLNLAAFALGLTAIVGAALLGTRFGRGLILPLIVLVLLALAAVGVTRQERFARGGAIELELQLARLGREAGRYPTHFASQYRLGNALARLHDCEHAIAPLQRAVALNVDDGYAQNDLGFALSCVGRFAEAVPPYRASVRLMPNELRHRKGLAVALEQAGDKGAAEGEYRAILFRWPNDVFAMTHEAMLRYDRGDRVGGLYELEQAASLNDTSYWVRVAVDRLARDTSLRGSRIPALPPIR